MMLEFEVTGGLGASRMDQQLEEGDVTHVAKKSTLASTSFIPTNVEEDMDILANVQYMAVVVIVASCEKTSFEDQL